MDKILQLIKKEEQRQSETLIMIPSENYTSIEVREAVGSVLMHKYSEGQVGKRYYQGNENIDEIEKICKERALELFNLDPSEWGVNVQALAGSAANLASINALIEPGDTILSMYLYDGGHLSHGWSYKDKKITLSSKIYNINFYHVNPDTGRFDYDDLEKLALETKPKLIISGGTAYTSEVDHKRISEIAKKVNAYYLADVSHEAGLIAGGVNKSPFKFADVVTMTTHKTLRGPRGALIFSKKELSEKIDSSVFPGIQGGPFNNSIAGIGIALEKAKSPEFKKYSKEVVKNAKTLALKLQDLGFTLIGNGTEKHLLLIDLRPMEINAWFVAWALEYAGIIVNRNTIPEDTNSPYYPSGIRLGTPAITARGMGDTEMDQIAIWIADVINHLEKITLPEDPENRQKLLKEFKANLQNDEFLKKIKMEVKEMTERFPLS